MTLLIYFSKFIAGMAEMDDMLYEYVGFRIVCPFSLSLWTLTGHVTSTDWSCDPATPAAAPAVVYIKLSKVTLTATRVISVHK